MELNPHVTVLGLTFLIALVIGVVANKTNFCTMGGVSDWINIGDTGRFRSWVFAMGVAMLGVGALQATGTIQLDNQVFPPYRSSNLMWLRNLIGGFMFGVGMTLASGCGNKTLVRVGGGNLKSLVVLAIAAFFAYMMLWGEDPFAPGEGFFSNYFMSWIQPTVIDLSRFGLDDQGLGYVFGGLLGVENPEGLQNIVALVIGVGLLVFAFVSRHFRDSFDNILGGAVIGVAIIAAWWITAGALGDVWKEWAAFAETPPARVASQSYTFISAMGDSVRYLRDLTDLSLISFGLMALTGVIIGSFMWAIFTGRFRVEWFRTSADLMRHVWGGILLGVGGVLSMGCTIGQGITGVSTLAIGSAIALSAIVLGSAFTLKMQYYLLDEGWGAAFRKTLSDLRILPSPREA
ncbi:MAG: YeeE/YedE family protein [Gammaproteobacteria bacterium]|nr:YeeE/YedE family protein [Gammaproteobacteria bacterium]